MALSLRRSLLVARSQSSGVRSLHSSTRLSKEDVVILSAARTPIGSYQGGLASLTATQLGTVAIKEALRRAGVSANEVGEAFLGNVVSAGVGQAPARQAAIRAGLPWSLVCTTVNKVCSSGMKSIMLGAQSIQLKTNECVLVGGFESMSNIPFYLTKARTGYGYGHGQIIDGCVHDGLTDAFDGLHMGFCAEACASTHGFTREQQDAYALESFRRAKAATEGGLFSEEIVGVEVPQRSGPPKVVSEDEQFKKLNASKVPTLKPAFKKDGTVTAANASALNDGACALVLASASYAAKRGLTPIGRISGFADAARMAQEFPTAPALAIPKALKSVGLETKDIDYWEINEAFAVVALANAKLLGIDLDRLNVNGGAVALGHPIGASGARIVTTLLSVLKQKKAKRGVAAICNGGGGASSIIVERL